MAGAELRPVITSAKFQGLNHETISGYLLHTPDARSLP